MRYGNAAVPLAAQSNSSISVFPIKSERNSECGMHGECTYFAELLTIHNTAQTVLAGTAENGSFKVASSCFSIATEKRSGTPSCVRQRQRTKPPPCPRLGPKITSLGSQTGDRILTLFGLDYHRGADERMNINEYERIPSYTIKRADAKGLHDSTLKNHTYHDSLLHIGSARYGAGLPGLGHGRSLT